MKIDRSEKVLSLTESFDLLIWNEIDVDLSSAAGARRSEAMKTTGNSSKRISQMKASAYSRTAMCPSCAEKIFEKKVYLESYQKICKSISASISLDEVLQLIATNVVKVMNVKASLLMLLNKERSQLELAAYHGLSQSYANKGPVEYDASIDDALRENPSPYTTSHPIGTLGTGKRRKKKASAPSSRSRCGFRKR